MWWRRAYSGRTSERPTASRIQLTRCLASNDRAGRRCRCRWCRSWTSARAHGRLVRQRPPSDLGGVSGQGRGAPLPPPLRGPLHSPSHQGKWCDARIPRGTPPTVRIWLSKGVPTRDETSVAPGTAPAIGSQQSVGVLHSASNPARIRKRTSSRLVHRPRRLSAACRARSTSISPQAEGSCQTVRSARRTDLSPPDRRAPTGVPGATMCPRKGA
jgi:hypothetical protein